MTTKEKPLFKDLSALKSFLLWAKAEGIQSLEVGGIKAQFAAAALPVNQEAPTVPFVDNRTPEQKKADEAKEYDDILFHSVS